ncbi:glycosyltransferase family 2 protein [Oidiodendron maius Zn]|uniref:Glycosyltransferase family 2 protein n=1 Tax=Oidiodendron maius (strain Zn) TaxID=913774 RepID=A0A0C3HQG0_OIDMZ|nr:glycosyltransferase family 2 protein [Oidiodendron maius Zn]
MPRATKSKYSNHAPNLHKRRNLPIITNYSNQTFTERWLKAYAPHVVLKLRAGKLGLCTIYVYGLKFVMGYFVVIIDADFSNYRTFIAQMIALVSHGASLFVETVLRPDVSDLTGRFRLYNRRVLEKVVESTESTGYTFQIERMVRAKAIGCTVAEVLISFVDRIRGESQ